MKKIFFVYAFLLFALKSLAQDTIPVINSLTLTGFGQTAGNAISNEIDIGGGKISSADGRVDIIFPANSLPAKTTISITPVTNMAPGGRGPSYKLEPSGMQFQKPAQIVFHYGDNDVNGGMDELQSIAYQDDKGQWYRIRNVAIDTIAKTISGSLTHFSVWANFMRSELKPAADLCSVGAQVSLYIAVNNPPAAPASPGDDDDLLAPPVSSQFFIWSVNGAVGGNGAAGTVSPVQGQNLDHVTFTAPASVPRRNPVEIAVEARNATFRIGRRIFRRLRLVSNIRIFDHFHYTFTGYSQIGHLHMIDSSSCDIKLVGDQVKVYNILNNPAWSDWPARIGRCSFTYPDRDNWAGLVEIGGVASAQSKVDPYLGILEVEIHLVPVMGKTPTIVSRCPDGGGGTIPSHAIKAFPGFIDFQLGLHERVGVYIDYGTRAGFNYINAVSGGEGFTIRMKAY